MLPRGKRSRYNTRFIIGVGVFARSARKVNLTACLISHPSGVTRVVPGALCDLVERSGKGLELDVPGRQDHGRGDTS